jgi:hypothetical protein
MPTESELARKDFADYEFIASEINRFLRMEPGEAMNHMRQNPQDALRGLYDPSGRMYLFSRDGDARFLQIVRRRMKKAGGAGLRHNLEAILAALKSEFMARLLDAERMITDENAGEIFEHVIAALDSGYRTLTHYIPCSVVAEDQPNRFSIGPITFVLQRVFLQEHETALRQSRNQHNQFLLPKMLEFFAEFRWVAIVTVEPCHPLVSEERSRRTIQRGLDLFKLMVGSGRASRVRQAYDVNLPDRTSHLLSDATSFSMSSRGKARDAVVADGWFEFFSASPYWRWAES